MITKRDIRAPIENKHRKAMLDLVLAWGSLDGALGMLLSRFLGVPMHLGAEEFGKRPGSAKFAEMIKLLRETEGAEKLVKLLRKSKKEYEKFSTPRDRIAHSHCAGIWTKDDDYVVFATFDRFGEEGLAIDAVPIDEMRRATIWAQEFRKFALRIVDKTEPN